MSALLGGTENCHVECLRGVFCKYHAFGGRSVKKAAYLLAHVENGLCCACRFCVSASAGVSRCFCKRFFKRLHYSGWFWKGGCRLVKIDKIRQAHKRSLNGGARVLPLIARFPLRASPIYTPRALFLPWLAVCEATRPKARAAHERRSLPSLSLSAVPLSSPCLCIVNARCVPRYPMGYINILCRLKKNVSSKIIVYLNKKIHKRYRQPFFFVIKL